MCHIFLTPTSFHEKKRHFICLTELTRSITVCNSIGRLSRFWKFNLILQNSIVQCSGKFNIQIANHPPPMECRLKLAHLPACTSLLQLDQDKLGRPKEAGLSLFSVKRIIKG